MPVMNSSGTAPPNWGMGLAPPGTLTLLRITRTRLSPSCFCRESQGKNIESKLTGGGSALPGFLVVFGQSHEGSELSLS